MENATAGSAEQSSTTIQSIRIWPMVVLAVTGLTCMTLPTLLGMADSFRFMTLAFGAALHLLLLAIWVLFGSRAPWSDRALFLILGIVGLVAVFSMQDKSLGIMVLLFGTPIAATCLALTLVGTNDQQVVLSVGPNTIGRSVMDGKERWRIKSGGMGNTMLQPVRFGKDQLLIASGEGDGTSLVEIKHTGENWQASKKWSSARLRPDFNDVVVVDSMILGLTKGLLTCVNSATGEMLWKKFRFGSGQLIALPNQRSVLVLSESGELSLIRVGIKEPTLLHAWQGIQGKTWNHPVLVKNRIYCRSAEEIACYLLE